MHFMQPSCRRRTNSAERSGARLRCARSASPPSAERVVELLELFEQLGERSVVVANLHTTPLWGSHADPAALVAVLAGEPVQAAPPDWDVGHFVGLGLLVRGPGGALVLVRDTYRELGNGGYHLQPAGALAAALERGDGAEGGILVFVPSGDAEHLRATLEEHGFELLRRGCQPPGRPPARRVRPICRSTTAAQARDAPTARPQRPHGPAPPAPRRNPLPGASPANPPARDHPATQKPTRSTPLGEK